MNELEPFKNTTSISLKIDHDRLRANMMRFKQNTRAKSTLRTYEGAWSRFEMFCSANGLPSLPADGATLCAYIEHSYAIGKKMSSISIYIAAINYFHKEARFPSPTKAPGVSEMLNGVRRTMAEEGRIGSKVKPNTTLDSMVAISAACGDNVIGIRNRAMILTAFGGWLRKSELLNIKVENISWNHDGFLVDLGKSKDNQDGNGRSVVEIPRIDGKYAALCPYTAMKKWLEVANISSGCVFTAVHRNTATDKALKSTDYIYELVMEVAKKAGIPPSEFAPHRAFRATPITLALMSGRPLIEVMQKARHIRISTTTYYVDRSAIDQRAIGREIYKSGI